jgi:cell division protein FtsI (penicillin-binding protein 3)
MTTAPAPTPETSIGPAAAPAGLPVALPRSVAAEGARRAQLEQGRARLAVAMVGFGVLFGAVALRLADVTVFGPSETRRASAVIAGPSVQAARTETRVERGDITDRNGVLLATSLPTAALYARPRELSDPADTARRLGTVLDGLDVAQLTERLSGERQFVYVRRQISPREQEAVNRLGLEGVYFQRTERRVYPQGRVGVHILGGADVDGRGIAGVERSFDARLRETPEEALRLTLDVRVQSALRDVVLAAMNRHNAIGAGGVVMDVRNGEVLAMVSLPDYDPADVAQATEAQRFNRTSVWVYEPGSTMKLITAAMALDLGTVNLWGGYDASRPLTMGRYRLSDFKGKNRWLAVPEIIAYSSNIGAARMALDVGPREHRAFLERMGLTARQGIEMPEAALPIVRPARDWKELDTAVIAFGAGIAVTPLHMVTAISAIANGGILYRPTLLARDEATAAARGVRVIRPETSDIMRRLMRLVVTDGSGKGAEVAGYFVGGKTGTAQKRYVGRRGSDENRRVSTFIGVFPMQAPRYAVLITLDEPKPSRETQGYATAGWVAAPAAGELIARIGPMLGMAPAQGDAPAIQAALAQPMQPVRPIARPVVRPAAGAAPAAVAARPAPARAVLPPETPRRATE